MAISTIKINVRHDKIVAGVHAYANLVHYATHAELDVRHADEFSRSSSRGWMTSGDVR